jgi:hypothetical protein
MKNLRAWLFGLILITLLADCNAPPGEIKIAENSLSTKQVDPPQLAESAVHIDLQISSTPTDPPPSATPTVPVTDTPEQVRECKDFSTGLVTCRIQQAFCSYHPSSKGKPTFCNDGKYPNYQFTYLVWGKDVSFLDGHCIIVNGEIEIYKGKLEIVSEDNSGFADYCDPK